MPENILNELAAKARDSIKTEDDDMFPEDIDRFDLNEEIDSPVDEEDPDKDGKSEGDPPADKGEKSADKPRQDSVEDPEKDPKTVTVEMNGESTQVPIAQIKEALNLSREMKDQMAELSRRQAEFERKQNEFYAKTVNTETLNKKTETENTEEAFKPLTLEDIGVKEDDPFVNVAEKQKELDRLNETRKEQFDLRMILRKQEIDKARDAEAVTVNAINSQVDAKVNDPNSPIIPEPICIETFSNR